MNALSNRTLALIALSLGTVLAFALLREHWGHVLGYLPYAILLACPLMHLFHGHGGGHQGHEGHEGHRHPGPPESKGEGKNPDGANKPRTTP